MLVMFLVFTISYQVQANAWDKVYAYAQDRVYGMTNMCYAPSYRMGYTLVGFGREGWVVDLKGKVDEIIGFREGQPPNHTHPEPSF